MVVPGVPGASRMASHGSNRARAWRPCVGGMGRVDKWELSHAALHPQEAAG